jgi:alpha-D-ribose 1-methylphosphonate 5-triphosphate synthase subunit PhnH
MITQTVKDAITIRDAQNYEYSQGIDMIFASKNGKLLSIPRLITKEDSH